MSHIEFPEEDVENLVAGHYSTGRGQVLRSDTIELTKIAYRQGFGADTHQHPEEQVLYVLEGCLRFTCGDDTYDVRPGEGSFTLRTSRTRWSPTPGHRGVVVQKSGGAEL